MMMSARFVEFCLPPPPGACLVSQVDYSVIVDVNFALTSYFQLLIGISFWRWTWSIWTGFGSKSGEEESVYCEGKMLLVSSVLWPLMLTWLPCLSSPIRVWAIGCDVLNLDLIIWTYVFVDDEVPPGVLYTIKSYSQFPGVCHKIPNFLPLNVFVLSVGGSSNVGGIFVLAGIETPATKLGMGSCSAASILCA